MAKLCTKESHNLARKRWKRLGFVTSQGLLLALGELRNGTLAQLGLVGKTRLIGITGGQILKYTLPYKMRPKILDLFYD